MSNPKTTWITKTSHSEESKKAISLSNKLTFSNPELRRHLSLKATGKHNSPDTEFKKGHLNGFKQGYTPWNKGKIIPVEEDGKGDGNSPYIPKTTHTNYAREWQRKRRLEVILHLGNKCMKCGFDDPRALQIDHKDGGGNKESKIYRASSSYYKMVMGDTSHKYQLLCANCNWIKKYENNEVIGRNKSL